MKIVHVATAFPRDDGDLITPWLGQLVLAQRRVGQDASVLAPSYRGGGATSWRGVPVRRFRYAPATLETLTHEETVPDRIRRRPLYGLLLPGYLAGGMIAALRVAREEPDVVHVHWPFPHALFGAVARAASNVGTAVVASFYSVEIRWVENRLPFLLPALRWSIETADAITAISTPTAEAVQRHGGRHVRVIPFAAALEEEPAPGASAGRPEGDQPFEILFVGRLVERKGVEVLIRALGRVRRRLDARLTVIGAGPRETAIRATIEAEGLEDHVYLAGAVDSGALAAAYRGAHAFALPAVVDAKGDTEGLGVVLLEALRSGLPVIGSDAGGIPDIIQDGTTGWLVPPGDADALADTILDVAADPEEVARRVRLGRQLVAKRFSLDRIVEDLAVCYREAVAHRRDPRGADDRA